MYNPLLHKERHPSPLSHPRTLPRPHSSGWNKSLTRPANRSRSRSPGRPQLSLVICPEFMEYPEGMREYSNPNSPMPSPRPISPHSGRVRAPFPFPPSTPLPVPHALARARGTEVLRDSASLPCPPVFGRLGARQGGPLARELSLPSSPSLPRIHIQDFGHKSGGSEVSTNTSYHPTTLLIV